jgi:hypothetical protein
MNLEQIEIVIRRHYQVSLALLEQGKRAIEAAPTEADRREAEERYRRMLSLHQRVEENYQRLWKECDPGAGDQNWKSQSPIVIQKNRPD